MFNGIVENRPSTPITKNDPLYHMKQQNEQNLGSETTFISCECLLQGRKGSWLAIGILPINSLQVPNLTDCTGSVSLFCFKTSDMTYGG